MEKIYNTSPRVIAPSELIINADGSIFHLHLRPEQLADTIILVGDPARVEMIAKYLDEVECRASNREFNSVTGSYKGKRMTVLSTGIGIGNIDISMTELDALANIDFATRTVKSDFRQFCRQRSRHADRRRYGQTLCSGCLGGYSVLLSADLF